MAVCHTEHALVQRRLDATSFEERSRFGYREVAQRKDASQFLPPEVEQPVGRRRTTRSDDDDGSRCETRDELVTEPLLEAGLGALEGIDEQHEPAVCRQLPQRRGAGGDE